MVVTSVVLVLCAAGLLVVGLAVGSNLLYYSSIVTSVLAAFALVVGARRAQVRREGTDGIGVRDINVHDIDAIRGVLSRDDLVGSDPPHDDHVHGDLAHGDPPHDDLVQSDPPNSDLVHSDLALGDRGGRDAASHTAGVDAAAEADAREGNPAAPPQTVGRASAPPPTGRASVPGQQDAWLSAEPPAAREQPHDTGTRPDESARVEFTLADEPAQQSLTAAERARLSRVTMEVVVVDGRPRYHLRECLHLLGRDCMPLSAAEAIELGFTPCGQCRPGTTLLASVPRQ